MTSGDICRHFGRNSRKGVDRPSYDLRGFFPFDRTAGLHHASSERVTYIDASRPRSGPARSAVRTALRWRMPSRTTINGSSAVEILSKSIALSVVDRRAASFNRFGRRCDRTQIFARDDPTERVGFGESNANTISSGRSTACSPPVERRRNVLRRRSGEAMPRSRPRPAETRSKILDVSNSS